MRQSQQHALVVYHGGDCMDGFTAAWVAKKALESLGDDVTTHPMLYGDPFPHSLVQEDSIVYVLDFSQPDVPSLEARVPVVMLDHHKSAQENFAGRVPTRKNSKFLFDMAMSGAMLAWQHFHPNETPPDLVRYVQDRDLWSWALPRSKEYNAYVGCVPQTFNAWNALATMVPGHVADLGAGALMHIEASVRANAQFARMVSFAGYRVPVVNAPYNIISELLGSLCESTAAPFAAGWFQLADGRYKYSLRSRAPHGIDVTTVAKLFPGGGGHAQAAGFIVDSLVATDPA